MKTTRASEGSELTLTIGEAASLQRDRKLSAVELTRHCLDHIEKLNPKLNAFITVTAERALADAGRCDEERGHGKVRGLLHGIPVAIKDVFCTRGVRTTGGSKLFSNYVPDHDAAVVERLQAAGAVILGKTSLHELAYGITSNNPHFGTVHNPWDLERLPGGSSGGSGSAVASGMCLMALGTDTGGSIRIPASFCGTVGLKPTTGRVSRYGILPLDFTLDHAGPLTPSVRDAAIVLNVIAGRDTRDDSSSSRPVANYLPPAEISLRGVRVGLPENFFFDRLDSEVERSVRGVADAAARLGAEVVSVKVPDMEAINATARVILLCEASAAMERFLDRRGDFGADVLALLDQGRLIPATYYINAQRLRRVYMLEFQAVWERADCLLTPATPTPAPRIGQTELVVGGNREDVRLASTRLVRGINLLGLPALSLPCGLSGEGLPIGAQIIGRAFEEELVLRIGAALEDVIGFRGRRPPVL
jgi:aspartyl-tRNA(Asn)/glutamyl-tRNA(Gln) amidotransferase subunit A